MQIAMHKHRYIEYASDLLSTECTCAVFRNLSTGGSLAKAATSLTRFATLQEEEQEGQRSGQ